MNTLGYFILSATVLSLPSTATAVAPNHGVFGQPVSNAELSQIRGRFVDGNKILFFGVSMRTDWHLNDGTLHEMEMRFNVDFNNGRFRPSLNLFKAALPSVMTKTTVAEMLKAELEEPVIASETSITTPETQVIAPETPITSTEAPVIETVAQTPEPVRVVAPDTGTPGTVVNDSLDNISGVVQNIQVAGDGNSVLNDVTWEVTDQQISSGSEALEEIATTSNTITSANNVTTQVQVQGDKIGYVINAPGQGQVSQQISSDAVRGLIQSTQLVGDINRVLNKMHLQIQVDPAGNNRRINNLRSTLSNLRGLN